MKKWKMRLTPEAYRSVAKLHPENKKQLKLALIGLLQNPYSGKGWQEGLVGFKSLRIKRYRAIYTVREEEQFIEIYHIGRRSDIYEQFRRLLNELQKPDN